MMSASPRNCSGERSPRGTMTWTAQKPSWRWLSTFAAWKRRNSVRSPFGEPGDTGGSGAPASSSCRNRRSTGEKSRSCDPVALQLLLDQLAHRLDADLVDHHLQAGAGAVDAQPVLAVEDPQDGLGVLEVLAVVGAHEVDQRRRDARHDRRAAADPHLEALDAVALAGDEGDVVDAGERAVGVRAGERGLDLARHQLRRGMADEVAHVGAGVRRRVEGLVVADAGPRVGGHVAHGVAAALAAGEAGVGDLADQRGRVAQRHVVHLDVLPRGDVALVQRRPSRSTTSANVSICSGVMPPNGSLTRIIWTSAWRWP